MKSNDHIKQLIKLSEENPDLKIIAKVSDFCRCEDEYSWIGANIGESTIEEYWLPSDLYIFEDDVDDELRCVYSEEITGLSIEEEETFIKNKYEELKQTGEIKTAIFVSIG